MDIDWQITYFTWIYTITTVVCLQLLFFIFNMQKIKGQISFQWMMMLAAGWTLVLTFESAAPTIPGKVLWSQFEYFANMGIPLLFLRFILNFNEGRDSWVKKYYPLFWIIPLITLVLVFTNRFHHLIWTGFEWSEAGMNILVYHHGPVFYLAMGYSLLLIIFSYFLLLWFIRKRPGSQKAKARYLIISASIPLLTGLLYTLGLSPLEGLNIAPMGLLIFGLIFLRGSARAKLFDLIPFSHQLMVEKMNDGVIVLDKDGIVLDISPAARKLLSVENIAVGNPAGMFFPGLNPILVSGGEMNEFREEIFIDLPEPLWIEVFRYPLRNSNGNFLGSLLLLHNITDRKSTEERLKKLASELGELNSMKDRLYSVIGHDLRSPFNAILGFSQLLDESYAEFSEQERRQFASNINMVARSTYDLLVNLLEWSSTQLGNTVFKPEKLNLHDIVEEIFQLLQFNASGKGLKLINSVEKGLIITADRNMFMVILRNLVSNGIKFSPQNESVEVLAMVRGDLIDIIVADTGIGMTPQMAEKLFRIDSLVTTTGTADEKGTGLGLVLSKEFIEKHRGKIRVMSEPGLGSRFIVTIPLN